MTERAYYAACALGLEDVLAAELRALGAAIGDARRGGVWFTGDQRLGYAAALWLRTAVRLQEVIAEGEVTTEQALYDFARAVDWAAFLRIDQTLAVDASVRDAVLTHSRYAALRIKDAVVDQFRDNTGRRPNVDAKHPDLPLKLHLQGDRATLYRDLSGESLHKRGYRPVQVKSPLNESIAAGLVLLSEWDRVAPLLDPMCGSGTIAIEAAWIAADRAPGLRRHYPFERWLDFDGDAWRDLTGAAIKRFKLDAVPPIECADQHPGAIAIARDAIERSGVRSKIRLTHKALHELVPVVAPGIVICNPPYGDRLDLRDAERSWRDLADFLRARCVGAVAFVLSGNPEIGRVMHLRASRKFPLHNGPIECRLLRYEIEARGARAESLDAPDAPEPPDAPDAPDAPELADAPELEGPASSAS